jgi:hypothetical protein
VLASIADSYQHSIKFPGLIAQTSGSWRNQNLTMFSKGWRHEAKRQLETAQSHAWIPGKRDPSGNACKSTSAAG